MKPITDVLAFGSADDPCFAKHYSPNATECRKCGDNELCCIAMAQKQKMKRDKMADTTSFKDLEDVDIDINNALKNIVITNKVTEWVAVCKLVKKKFGYSDIKEAKDAIRKAVKTQKIFKLIKKDEQRYIKPIKA